jgi:hypothetical protein
MWMTGDDIGPIFVFQGDIASEIRYIYTKEQPPPRAGCPIVAPRPSTLRIRRMRNRM